jgi:hypothetical protein
MSTKGSGDCIEALDSIASRKTGRNRDCPFIETPAPSVTEEVHVRSPNRQRRVERGAKYSGEMTPVKSTIVNRHCREPRLPLSSRPFRWASSGPATADVSRSLLARLGVAQEYGRPARAREPMAANLKARADGGPHNIQVRPYAAPSRQRHRGCVGAVPNRPGLPHGLVRGAGPSCPPAGLPSVVQCGCDVGPGRPPARLRITTLGDLAGDAQEPIDRVIKALSAGWSAADRADDAAPAAV